MNDIYTQLLRQWTLYKFQAHTLQTASTIPHTSTGLYPEAHNSAWSSYNSSPHHQPTGCNILQWKLDRLVKAQFDQAINPTWKETLLPNEKVLSGNVN